MLLTGRELIEKQIITGEVEEKQIQQVGVDLKLMEVQRILDYGAILTNKTILPLMQHIPAEVNTRFDTIGWLLQPGPYAIRVDLGCNIPDNITLFIRQRSSLLRIGGLLHSSVFDPGYICDPYVNGEGGIGTVMHLNTEIFIEHGARIAQIYASESNVVAESDLYGSVTKGSQWQNGK